MIRIVKGRGNRRRTVIEMPHASVVQRSPENQREEYKRLLCDILNVAYPVTEPVSA